VHSTKELSRSSFTITRAGHAAGLEDVFPGFGAADRLGMVVRRPGGGAGASLLILAAVTGFYDIQRQRGEPFFAYPDYFVFHAGARFGDHRKLEIWPPHKEVVVAQGGAETLLQAINDRAVTRLVVEDGEPGPCDVRPETLASARSRITTCIAYAPGGRVRDGDVAIAGNGVTERYVAATLADAADRRGLVVDGRPVEGYRSIELDEALGLLDPVASGAAVWHAAPAWPTSTSPPERAPPGARRSHPTTDR
jgi:hypothetical protein